MVPNDPSFEYTDIPNRVRCFLLESVAYFACVFEFPGATREAMGKIITYQRKSQQLSIVCHVFVIALFLFRLTLC